MKKVCLYFLYLISVASCKDAPKIYQNIKNSNINFDGEWFYSKDTISMMRLELKSTSDSTFVGNVSCISKGGDVSDSVEGDNFFGLSKKDTIYGVFYSQYSPKSQGEVKIWLDHKKNMVWDITKKPQGEYHIFNNVTMNKIE